MFVATTSAAARSDLAHLLRRAGFGATPAELDAAVRAGYEATVESLLSGLSGPDPTGEGVALPDLTIPPVTVAKATDAAAHQQAVRARQQVENKQYLNLQRWWLNRMIATSTPLREKMTLLWHGHFATAFQKVHLAKLMYDQNQLFRTVGAGSFEALTQAVAKDPAMMIWLDTETDAAQHPNENFARELMELFTLGIGNYTESDVQNGARAFTGWSLTPETYQFVERPRRHDDGVKTFLGHSGNFDGADIVHIVTHDPAGTRFVVARLWSHLAYPVATNDAVVGPLAAAYAEDLDIASLLRAIFRHPQFTSDTAKQGLVKQPVEWLVGIGRALAVDADLEPAATPATTTARTGRSPMGAVLTLLGQELFNPPNVGGWAENGYWLNTATSLARLQAALSIAERVDLTWLHALPVSQRPGAIADRLSIDGWGPTTAAALNHVAARPATLLGLALTAPEYVLN